MAPQYFVSLAIGAGVFVPIIWFILNWAFLEKNPSIAYLLLSEWHLDRVMIAVWPSSILLLADPKSETVVIPLISTAVNAALYGGLGWLVWLGLYKNRIVLAVPILLILVGWYFLLSWYTGS